VEGLYALLVASGGLTLFALINLLGGSGFLAIYLAGVLVGNRRSDATDHVFRVMDGLAWLAQATMFLVLGLLATPSLMGEYLPGAVAVATFLILVARPVAIWLGLAPFRYPLREIAFISWVGLRGAVPIVLALFPLLAGIEGGRVIFDLVFAVVLISLLVQGTTLHPVARWLRVQGPARDQALDRVALQMPLDAEMELAQFAVPEGSPWVGRPLAGWQAFGIPDSLVCAVVLREGRLLPLEPELRVAGGDVLIVLQPRSAGDLLAEYLAPASGFTAVALGTFALDGEVEAGDLADAYGLRLADAERKLAVADLVRRRLRHPVVPGDQLDLGPVVLVVRQAERGRPVRLGLRLAADEPG
jgi:cell volume regulation protein A